MPESDENPAATQNAGGAAEELKPPELDRLTELVYRLLKEDILRGRERRGESMARAWR
jgi:DNA-binding GntR family transcriptional regulator